MEETDDRKLLEEERHEKKRQDFVAGLRELADFYEQAPLTMPLPVSSTSHLDAFVHEWDEIKVTPAEIARILGKCEKKATPSLFYLRRRFGPIQLDVNFMREAICERIVKKVQVPERVLPACEEKVIPAHEEEVVEWDCSKSIFADVNGKA